MVVRRTKPSSKKSKTPDGMLKVPAGDSVNEGVVIAAVITDLKARKRYLPTILPETFLSVKHSIIWTGLQELYSRRLEYSIDTLKQLIGDELDVEYLEELVESRGSEVKNVRHHVDVLHWDKTRADLAEGPVAEFLHEFRDPKTQPTRLRTLLKQCDSMVSGYGSQHYLRDGKQLAREQDAELTKLREGHAIYPFGIDALDYYNEDEDRLPVWADKFIEQGRRVPRLVPGTVPGMLSVVSGLSGTGKTTTALRAVLTLAEQGRKSLVGAWEIDSGMSLRILAGLSLGWHRTDLMTGNFSRSDQKGLVREMERLSEHVQFFELPFGKARGERQSNDRNLDIIHQVVADSGCDIFWADLLKKAMKETDASDEEQFIGRMSAIAQETKCHVVALHQLKGKEVEATKDKIPRRSHLKGSSAWWEGPALIIVWHRPGMWKNIPDDKMVAYVWKQRHGEAPLAVEIDYDAEYATLGEGRSIPFAHSDSGKDETDGSFGSEFLGGDSMG